MQERLWDRIRSGLKSSLPPHVYASLVETARCAEEKDSHLHLDFSDSFCKENFEEKCLDTVKALLTQMALTETRITLGVSEDIPRPSVPTGVELPTKNPFDQKYSFENFVVGSSNQFAHAACQAVAKQPGQCYNPLFIFGGAGLGKTHLLKAIGHEIRKREKDAKILLLTSESFTNELIQAIRIDRMREFRDKYRNHCDVILLDDIHFMAGKERTQEEFFYTFNYLHEARKQIVITSDRYPKDIQGLEARLQTRFEWGLVADVQPPDTETRIAILKNKADSENIKLPDPVASYIASHITSNIRELEGSLHRLQAYAALTGVPISLELAQQILRDIAPKVKHELTPDGILKLVALQFNQRTTDIRSDKRTRKLSLPRQICMYLLRKHLLMSYPEIGRFMGGKDHTTILHGVSKIAELQRNDAEILSYINSIESLIR